VLSFGSAQEGADSALPKLMLGIRRREFITLLGGATAWPLAARAQQPAMPVIGFLKSMSATSNENLVAAFRQGLSEMGYVDGRNIKVEYHWAEGNLDRLPALAADLVRRRVAVIVTPGDGAALLAAKAATSTIPIVFSGGGDPVERSLVASLNRPGGNVTGFVELNSALAPKRLAILHDLLPGASRFALLVDQRLPPSVSDIADLQAAASSIRVQLEVIPAAATVPTLETAFATLMQKRIDAVMVSPSPLFYDLRLQFAEVAARFAMPAIYWDRELVVAGGLMSYGSSVTDQFRQVGNYAGRILKGEQPADLPVQQPTKFPLVVNLKSAKALGITVPPTLLPLADEVIE
jgi:putative ABC transport system substrate-binding protein